MIIEWYQPTVKNITADPVIPTDAPSNVALVIDIWFKDIGHSEINPRKGGSELKREQREQQGDEDHTLDRKEQRMVHT